MRRNLPALETFYRFSRHRDDWRASFETLYETYRNTCSSNLFALFYINCNVWLQFPFF